MKRSTAVQSTSYADIYDPQTLTLEQTLDQWERIENAYGDDGARALCLEDLYYLLVRICNRVDMLHPWVYARCREFESDPDGHLDLWAREHYKSTIITFGKTLQDILRDPEITIGIFSHTAPIAKAFLKQIKRELETNVQLKQLFPEIVWDNPDKDAPNWSIDNGITVRRNSNPKEATVEAWGLVDAMPTSKHYKLRIYDDVVTDKSVYTAEQNQRTIDAFSLSQALGAIDGAMRGIGTRYSFADAYDWIITRNVLNPRLYPATHNGLKDGDPVYFTRQEWEKRKRNHTDSDIACQYLQNPIAGESRMFDVNDLQVYEVRPLTLMAYLLIDPARSVKKESAHTAMVVLGVDAAGNKYLLDGVDHPMDLMDRWKWMRDLWAKWKNSPGIMGLHVGYERFGAIADLDYFHERQRIEGARFEITELEWPRDGNGSKNDRVQRLVPDVKGHRLYLPYPTDDDKLTKIQRNMISSGYGYRVARPIVRKDNEGVIYDLTDRFRMQIAYFPFGTKKDIVDATSRVYDMDMIRPEVVDNTFLEPEYI